MGSFKSKVHPVISAYFDSEDCALFESFKAGRGWLREAPRLSLARLRQLRADGVTMISVKCGERIADFAITEVTNSPRAFDLAPAQRDAERIAELDARETDRAVRALAFAYLDAHSTAAAQLETRAEVQTAKRGASAEMIAEADRLYLELRDAARDNGISAPNIGRWARALPEELIDACATRAALSQAPRPSGPAMPDYPPLPIFALPSSGEPISVIEVLIGLRNWAASTHATHMHYGIEQLIAGADALIRFPSTLDTSADIRPFMPKS